MVYIIYTNEQREDAEKILLQILYCYFNNAGVFSKDMQQDEKDTLLVNICEEEITGETGEWIKLGRAS